MPGYIRSFLDETRRSRRSRAGAALVLAMTCSALLGDVAAARADAPACSYESQAAFALTKLPRGVLTLRVHTSPTPISPVTYDLPAWATAIRCVGPCRDGFCRIRWHGVVGFVPRQYLRRDGVIRRTTDAY